MDLIKAGFTLGRLIQATEEFNEIYNLINLSDYLDGLHLSKYEELCDEYKASLAKAKLVAKDLDRNNENAGVFDCLHCGESDTAIIIEVPTDWDKESRTVTGSAPHMVCQFCNYKDILIDCCICGVTYCQLELEEWNEEFGDHICEGCLGNIYHDE
jgi:hypothetical protein